MKMKQSAGDIVFRCINGAFMILLMIVCVYPLYYVLAASLSNSNLLIAHSGLLFMPLGLNLDAYRAVFDYPIILRSYLNTLIVVVSGVSVSVILTIFGGYFLSRGDICLKKLCMMLIIFTMFFTGGLIPFYLTVKALKLMNTYWALILPAAVNTFNLIIMRTAFMEVPKSLEESAKIDGANDLVLLFRIILPVVMPTVAVIILYYGVAQWNAWFHAMIFIKDRELFPIQLVLREILIQKSSQGIGNTLLEGDNPQIAETIKYATVIVATLPILVIYPFLQKYFVKGVMVGSVKG